MDSDELMAFDAHERLKTDLRRRGKSLSSIARDLGVTSAAVSFVGLRRNRSAKIEKALAAALDTTPETLFPDLNGKGKK